MIRFQRITRIDDPLYAYMEELLTDSFPSEEYRPLEELRHYIESKSHFYMNIIFSQDKPIGIISYWDFENFYYAEHFAISPAERNGGYGRSALSHLCQLLQHPIILEVETPQEEMAQRRINFYKRQDFALWERPYMQPPYRSGDNHLPMLLMAHGNLVCDKDYDTIKQRIYKEVYNQKG